MNINDFKKGDQIVRVSPVKEESYNLGFGSLGGCRTTDSYYLVGQKVEFVGIANGLIYYKDKKGMGEMLYKKYREGWEKFIDPTTL